MHASGPRSGRLAIAAASGQAEAWACRDVELPTRHCSGRSGAGPQGLG